MKKIEPVISLKKGIGEINFGLSVEQVVSIVGNPDEVEEIGEDIDYPTTIMHYDDNAFSLFFDNTDVSKLVCIDIDSEDVVLFGKKIMGLSSKEIVALMVANDICKETIEKEDWGELRVSFEDYSIDFYFIDDKLVSITFGK